MDDEKIYIAQFGAMTKDGFKWSKFGDFGLVAVGRNPSDVEVDFTLTSPAQISSLLATAMVVAASYGGASKEAVEKAIEIYRSKIKK